MEPQIEDTATHDTARKPGGGPDDRLGLTVEEAAALLGISRAFAYELVADGSLPCLRLRRRIVVPRVALLRMLDGTAARDDDRPGRAS